MLDVENSLVAVIDTQEALCRVMPEREEFIGSACRLILGAKALGMPVVWVEHCPGKLGATVPPIAGLLDHLSPITKTSFSCCGEEKFVRAIEGAGRDQLVLCGIEAHVCIYQTASDLACRGYEVQVAADAVSSRKKTDKEIALQRLRAKGIEVTSVESALFELVRDAESPAFRHIIGIVR